MAGREIIQSAGGVIYYLDDDKEPKYLIIKRHAVSKKIEWVCPKGKLEAGETTEEAALREVSEEAGLPINKLKLKDKLGVTKLRSARKQQGMMNKDTSYFLMEYSGDPDAVSLIDGEGYIGIYKWANLEEVVGLIYYQDLREIIRKSYAIIKQENKDDSVKKDFINSL